MNQDFIIRKSETGFQVLEMETNCEGEKPCEYCKDRICEKEENMFYSGFEVSPKVCRASTIRYNEVKSAYLLYYDEANIIFKSVENIVFLAWQYIMYIYEKYKSSNAKSGCYIRTGIGNSFGNSICLDKECPEGIITEYSIDDKQYFFKHDKYYKPVKDWLYFLCENSDLGKHDSEESPRLFYKKLENPYQIEIPKDEYFNIKKRLDNCLKTIYLIFEMKYSFCELRGKYLSVVDDDDYKLY